jgi:hypothetical protein
MDKVKMTVYVTKYALSPSTGIFTKEVEIDPENGLASHRESGSVTQFYHKGEYELTREDAVKSAEEMRIKKLKSLDNQIKKVSALKFD